MERASVATDGDSRTAMDGPNPKQSCPLEWVLQGLIEQLHPLFPLHLYLCNSWFRYSFSLPIFQ